MEMDGVKHMSHDHPLILTKYNITPENAICYGCNDIIMVGTSVYTCSRTCRTSTASLASACANFFLHKTCLELPHKIQDPRHKEHLLSLDDFGPMLCAVCESDYMGHLLYMCRSCLFTMCLQCVIQERNLNHEFHSHPLTILPIKSVFTCGACGVKGIEEFSYICRTCLFWIHKSCALAPKTLICELHHHDHPLLLLDHLPRKYNVSGLVCSICKLEFDICCWLYYCADCRFFAHMECATKPIDKNATDVDDEEDCNHSELVQFPVSDDKHYLYYQLIQQFAKAHSSNSTTEDVISHCKHGHPLVLIDEHMRKDIEELNELICHGCFQPLSFAADSFYGCANCKIFLHKVCSTELPGAMEHPSHPKHMLLRCQKIGDSNKCNICNNECNGIFYQCERSTCSFFMDIMCASLPRKIKHESHRHSLKQLNELQGYCSGCNFPPKSGSFFRCNACQFKLHVGCAISPGTVKHRWDEHKLRLMYPPVKHHPHDFNCEFCSKDINPNYWFYHCRECDMSFDLYCIKKGDLLLANFHRHNLRFPGVEPLSSCAIL